MNEKQFEALTGMGTYAYEQLIRYNTICWVIGAISGAVMCMASYLVMRKIRSLWDKEYKRFDEDAIPWIVVGAGLLILGIPMLILNGLAFAYPEGATISHLIEK